MTKALLAVYSLALFAVGLAGCTSPASVMDNARLRNAVIAQTPAVKMVSGGGCESAMRAADLLVARFGSNEYQALLSEGESMEPLYRPGTALVVKRIKYAQVKRGMTVVYWRRDRDGISHLVAHVVIDEDAKGWVVQGLNNAMPDIPSINERNMVGVVVAAFAAAPNGALSAQRTIKN